MKKPHYRLKAVKCINPDQKELKQDRLYLAITGSLDDLRLLRHYFYFIESMYYIVYPNNILQAYSKTRFLVVNP